MTEERAAYALFEKTILEFYKQQKLTLSLLDHMASRYRYVATDSAGSQYLRTHDNKDLWQVCIELVDPTFPIALGGSREDHEEYWEQELQVWEKIVHARWNWQAYCTVFSMKSQSGKTD